MGQGFTVGVERDPATGLDRYRVERAASAGSGIYGRGWFAMNIRTGVGAWKPTHAEALAFAIEQVHAQAERIGVDLGEQLERIARRAAMRAGADRLRQIAGLVAPR